MSDAVTARDEARELSTLIRDWRKGRATASIADVLSDYYMGVLAVVMLGAMFGNVVLTLSRQADKGCVGAACVSARSWLPWLVVGATVAIVLGLARLLGPVSASPAVVSWLLSSPADRTALVRPRLGAVLATGAGITLLVGLPVAVLSGLAPWAVACFATACALAGVATVAIAARSQQRESGVSRAMAMLLVAVVWVALLGLAYGWWPELRPAGSAGLSIGALVLAAAAAATTVSLAWQGVSSLDSRQLSAGGRLSVNLSGALAGLDLTLAYDVVVAHRSRQRGGVRPVRGGPGGAWALPRRDLVRIRRAPLALLLLFGSVVAPYAAARAGGGVVTILVAVLALWPATAPQLLALRVLTRGRSVLGLLPYRDWVSRGLTMLVPGLACLCAGVATAPAIHEALATTWAESLGLATAVGVGGFAAAVRWISGRPANYRAPMVSTPAGAVPSGAVAALMRGFDVALLSSAPMLLLPDGRGAAISVVLSAIVIVTILFRRD